LQVSFTNISIGQTYSRESLAKEWGYSSFHAIARGVVTPSGDNKIILFVTEKKQSSSTQYVDRLEGVTLFWEGPRDHFAEQRMLNASASGEQIHLFHRKKHHEEFTYMGTGRVVESRLRSDRPSEFKIDFAAN
jgi:hypothetical protein